MKLSVTRCFCHAVGAALIFSSLAHADVIVSDASGNSTVIDSDDPSLPDPDPTVFAAGNDLSSSEDLFVDGNSVVELAGGNWDGFNNFFSDNSTFIMTSGTAQEVVLDGNSSTTISGGSVTNLAFFGTNDATITGGNVSIGPGTISGNVVISGGNVDTPDFILDDQGSLEISGGSFGASNLDLFGGSEVTISGGNLLDGFPLIGISGQDSVLNLIGSDFLLVTNDFDNNVFTETAVSGIITDSISFDGFVETILTGTLEDGTEFTLTDVSLSGGGVINLVAIPEPGTFVLLGLAGCLSLSRRKRSGCL